MAINFCLPKENVEKFVTALKSGELDLEKLSNVASSEERRATLAKYVGEGAAQRVNAELESKLLLKNQNQGFATFIKSVMSKNPSVGRDMLSKAQRLDKVLTPDESEKFLHDFVAQRLGTEVTPEQADHIATLARDADAAKSKWNEKLTKNEEWSKNPTKTRKEWAKDEDRLAYGYNAVKFKNYTDELKLAAEKIGFREAPLQKIFKIPMAVPGLMKSILSSMDDSFFGRQGIAALLDPRYSAIWGRNFAKSLKDIPKQVFAKGSIWKSGDDAVMDSVRADIMSRPNALNGKYHVADYGLNVAGEEAFPSTLPEKIPLFNRLFKGSMTAYDAGALRMRADLADNLIFRAEKSGKNMLNKDEAKGVAHLVGGITGRGSLGKAEPLSKEINNLLFSGKFLKGNFDSLTAHIFDKAVRQDTFARKEAAKNLLFMTSTVAGVMTLANTLNPGSVDLDPRSAHFGKIKINGEWTDITGGRGAIATLAARIVPTVHNGQLGFWSKSSSGTYKNLTSGAFGAQTAADVFTDFFKNRAAPALSTLFQLWKGQDFNGNKLPVDKPFDTGLTIISNQGIPIPITNGNALLNDPGAGFALGSIMLDALGFSTNATPQTKQAGSSWQNTTSQQLLNFKSKVGDQVFNEANKKADDAYNLYVDRVSQNPKYKAMNDTDKTTLLANKKSQIRDETLKTYGFKYKATKKDQTTTKELLSV